MDLAREPSFRLGGMEVRPATRELVFDGRREVLEPRVMAVLVRLAQAKGEVVTRDDLTEACWEGRVVSDDAINRVISRIRRAADLTGGRDFNLETITKVGYRLVGAPAAHEAAQASPQRVAAATQAKPAPKQPVLLFSLMGVVIAAILAAAWWAYGREPKWTPQDPTDSLTLAVLPFDNIGTASEDAALAIAMSREIRNTLSRVRGLRVVADSSSFAVASEALSAPDMGKRLNADLLLDGSLVREGDTIRLSAELVDGWSGVNLWTGSNAGPATDLQNLRTEMSAQVFQQLVQRIGPNRIGALSPPKAIDQRAYSLLVEAEGLLESTSKFSMRGELDRALDAGDKANELIDQALAIEPGSALGLRLKARTIGMAATREQAARTLSDHERMDEGAVYLRRALAADPDNSSVLQALGEYYRRYQWRWADARSMLERALALDPNHIDAHLSYAYYLSGAGRCVEALQHSQAAIEIDPEFGWRTLGVPRALKCLGRFEEADAAYRKALEHDPANMFVLREVYLNMLVRRDAAGLRDLRTYVRDTLWKGAPPPNVRGWLRWTEVAANALDGDTAPFIAFVEEDIRVAGVPGVQLGPGIVDARRGLAEERWIQAIEFAIAGAPKRSLDMFEASMKIGTLYIPETMPYGPFEFSPEVRADPRYQTVWKTDPRLAEIVALRLEAVKAGQMYGVLPDGTKVVPKVASNVAG
jgi:TolB-like protein/DNA-binding winged helix-turn-helix (wHTH) protein/Flp pilus assembly protein TadD